MYFGSLKASFRGFNQSEKELSQQHTNLDQRKQISTAKKVPLHGVPSQKPQTLCGTSSPVFFDNIFESLAETEDTLGKLNKDWETFSNLLHAI